MLFRSEGQPGSQGLLAVGPSLSQAHRGSSLVSGHSLCAPGCGIGCLGDDGGRTALEDRQRVVDGVLVLGGYRAVVVDWKSVGGTLTDAQLKLVKTGFPLRFVTTTDQLDILKMEMMR